MQEKLRVGILGLGMAGGFMAPIVASHPRTTLTCAADLDPALRDRFIAHTGLPAYEDAAALFNSNNVDVVYIATPHQYHAEQTIRALQAGKHVVVEKPMALSLQECDAMINAASSTNRILIVGHTHGFDPAPRAIRDLVLAKRHGPLAMINTFNFTDFIYRPRRPEELDTQRGGGIFYNQLPHQIDIVRVAAAEPIASVRCASGILDPARPTQGHLAAFLTFRSGASASIIYSGHDRFDSDEFYGDVGEIGYPRSYAHGATARTSRTFAAANTELDIRRDRYGYGSGAYTDLQPPPHLPHFGFLLASCAHADIRQTPEGLTIYSENGVEVIPLPGNGTYAGHANVWNDCYHAVHGINPIVQDAAFSRHTVLITQLLLQSASENRELEVPVMRER